MGNLSNALQQLRSERKQAQSHVEKLDHSDFSYRVIKRFGNNPEGKPTDPNHIEGFTAQDGAGATGKMGKGSEESQPVAIAKTTASAPVKHTMSAAARRKIAAFQRARWAKIKAQQRKAA